MKTDRPITRKEQYLAKAAGVTNGDTPPAVTKEEQYLKKIADNITGLTENPLPEVSSEDEGKVPVVGSDGKWELGEGGGGSGLPPYSVDDIGKVLMVVPATKVLVPEQIVELEAAQGGGYYGVLTDVSIPTNPEKGDQIYVTYYFEDDDPYDITLTYNSSGFWDYDRGSYIIEYDEEDETWYYRVYSQLYNHLKVWGADTENAQLAWLAP